MTKQEKIQESYGEYWEAVKDYVDENGFIIMAISITRKVHLVFERKVMYNSKSTSGIMEMCVRPICLENIENNNGWINIESEDDLPKEGGQYLTYRENKIIINEWFYDNDLSWYLWKDCYLITHYQPIVKPQPPIY